MRLQRTDLPGMVIRRLFPSLDDGVQGCKTCLWWPADLSPRGGITMEESLRGYPVHPNGGCAYSSHYALRGVELGRCHLTPC